MIKDGVLLDVLKETLSGWDPQDQDTMSDISEEVVEEMESYLRENRWLETTGRRNQ